MSPHPRHRKNIQIPVSRRIRRASAPALILAFTTAATGCSVPPVPGLPGASGAPDPVRVADTVPLASPAASAPAQAPSAASPSAFLSPAPAPTAAPGTAPKAAASWVRQRADMDRGSAHHVLDAAAHKLMIDYWTSDDPGSWTPESSPIIRLNAHISGADDGNTVKVTRFNARVDSLGVVLANDQGDFALTPPYSYASGVVVPANPKAHSTRILFTFDLLTETAPNSGVYTRQTILDTLTLGYAKSGAQAQSPN